MVDLRMKIDYAVSLIVHMYLWDKHKEQYDGSTNDKACAIHHSKDVLKVLQSDGGHQNDGQYDAADVNAGDDEGGVIQTLDVHLSDGEGKDERHDLEHGLVAVENADGDSTVNGVADVDGIPGYDATNLFGNKNTLDLSEV